VAEPEEVMAAADVVSSAGPTPVVVKRPTPQVAPEPEPIVAVVVEPTVEAQPASPIDPDGEGRVTISSLPKAKVYIDGDFVRSTPLFRYTIPAGARDIELRTADGRSHQFRLNVRDGADINRVWSFEEARFVGN
jgi:hypothetical protein